MDACIYCTKKTITVLMCILLTLFVYLKKKNYFPPPELESADSCHCGRRGKITSFPINRNELLDRFKALEIC